MIVNSPVFWAHDAAAPTRRATAAIERVFLFLIVVFCYVRIVVEHALREWEYP